MVHFFSLLPYKMVWIFIWEINFRKISVVPSIAETLTAYVSCLSEFKSLAGTLDAVLPLPLMHKAKVFFHKSGMNKSEGAGNNSFDF